MLILVRIKGIPASVDVHSAKYSRPDPKADSDWDFYGGWSLDYTICDQRGRPAPWLENKLNYSDLEEIERQIIEEVEGLKECV